MTEVLDMDEQRRRIAAKKGFQAWTKRFSEPFDEKTCIGDFSDAVLASLIRGGEESSMPLYELILGVMGLGAGPKFYYLENQEMMAVMDIALFLLDQCRFEAMRRLGWVEESISHQIPLVDLVRKFPDYYSRQRHQTPRLCSDHPRHQEYQNTFEADRGPFIRRLIPDAIEAFQSRLH